MILIKHTTAIHVGKKANNVDAHDNIKKRHNFSISNSLSRLRYTGLRPGTEYLVTVSTTFRGTEVAENRTRFVTRPLPPPASPGVDVRWGFDVGSDGGILYKAEMSWVRAGGAEEENYFVEVRTNVNFLKDAELSLYLVAFRAVAVTAAE